MLRVGSLFSGGGLCDLGLHWAGMRHQWFCEIDPFCRAVLARHWPGTPIYKDVVGIDSGILPRVDVLCGGFPCQDVSNAGMRAGIAPGTRSGLWYEYRRIIDAIRPRYVIAENVRGLLSCGIESVLQDLAAIGYDAEWEVLGAGACGAPHHRERVFIVAYPRRAHTDRRAPVLSALKRKLENDIGPYNVFGWAGIRFDRARKDSAAEAFGRPVICRVDDGRSDGLDAAERPRPGGRPSLLGRVDLTTAKAWVPRLRALGNAITPQQSYAVAACVLQAEGLPVKPMP